MSISANAGDRIKISPTTSGVSALPPTVSLFYEITESLSDVAPPTPGNINWENFSVAQAEINAAGVSGSVDFGDRYFRPEVGVDGGIDVPFDFSITGGTFTAGVEITGWTDQGGGIWRGNIPSGHAAEIVGYEYLVDYNNLFDRKKLTTADGAVDPVLARYHSGPTDFTYENSLSYNSAWWEDGVVAKVTVDDWQLVTNQNLTGPETTSDTYPWTSGSGNNLVNYSGVINGLILTGDVKEEFEVVVGANATDFVIMYKAGANRIAFAAISNYNQLNGEIDFVEDGINYTGYSPFTVSGSPALIVNEREYTIDTVNNHVYYRNVGGTQPTDTFLITGSNQGGGVFNFASSNAGFPVNDFTNVKVYGASSMTASVAYGITGSTGSARINVQGCTFGYGAGLVRSGGYSSEETDGSATGSSFTGNTFFKYNQIALVTSEGATVSNNICIYPAARSFVLATASNNYHGAVGTDYVPNKLTFMGNYVFAPCCNHGQAISAYEGSFLNCDIKNNILRGMRAVISFQPGDTKPNPTTGTSSLNIEDNWMVYDQEVDRLGAGQATIAFNGGNDNWLTSPDNHTFTMARNGQYIPESMYRPDLLGGENPWIDIDTMRVTMAPYNNCPTHVINNTGFVAAAVSADNSQSKAGGNAYVAYDYTSSLDVSYTNTDIGWKTESITPDQAYSELQPLALGVTDTAVNALGGGPAGPRWSSFPALSELSQLDHSWSSTYAATGDAVPDGTLITESDTDDRDFRATTRDWDIADQSFRNTNGQLGYTKKYPLEGETPTQLSSISPDVAYSFGKSGGLVDIITAEGNGNARITIQLKNPSVDVSNPWTNDITDSAAFKSTYGTQVELHTIIGGVQYSMLLANAATSSTNLRFNALKDSSDNVLTYAMAQAVADGSPAQLWMDLPPLP